MAIHRVRVSWAGSPVVGPGVSTFYAKDMASDALLDGLVAFYGGLAIKVPSGVTWNVASSGDILNESDGSLAGSWSFPGSGGPVTSSGSGNFVNGVGARIKWRTNGTHGGRRVVGSTFIVPLSSTEYEGAGNILAGTVTSLQNAGNALVTAAAGDMVIWSKNKEGQTDGEASPVTAAVAPDLVSWLRSRRT